jgi:hypothetical protein
MKTNTKVPSQKKLIIQALIVIAITAMFLITLVMPADSFYRSKHFNSFGDIPNSDISKTGGNINPSKLSGEKIDKKTTERVTSSKENSLAPLIEYNADITEGSIGIDLKSFVDNGVDNIFKFSITEEINLEDKVILSYDLYGVEDQSSVTRSINERYSVGGYIVKKTNTWSKQKEIINPSWLKIGLNTVSFSTTDNDNFYKIKNLKIQVYKQDKRAVRSAIIVQPTEKYFSKNGKIYIRGFLQKYGENTIVEVNGEKADINNGEFEVFVPKAEIASTKSFFIKAFDNHGLLGQEVVPVLSTEEADYAVPIENFPTSVKGDYFDLSKQFSLENGNAAIQLKDSSINHPIQIAVSKLRKMDIHPLEPGMINVTKGAVAYRFTPDGTTFRKNIEITIGYDTTLIPIGYSASDIKTYFYNIKSKRWELTKIDSIDKKHKIVLASTNHFTDYINGIIKVPESPQTSAYAPTTLNGIKAADPSAKLTLISPPEASQTGEADVSYPINIPSGRKGMQPSLKLQYNSNGGSDWVGNGWDLNVPGISIDTRWGVPTFGDLNGDGNNTDPGENIETEIYSLGGEQLMYPQLNVNGSMVDWMPNRHYVSSTGVYSTVSRTRLAEADANFTFRKQGSFAKIQRLGNSPSSYYWKVTGTDGTISWYGGKTSTDVQNGIAVITNPNGNIVYWALFMTEDVYGNDVRYYYTKSTFPSISGVNANLAGGQSFHLSSITYTGFNGSDGNYKVDFITDNTVKLDVSINGRNGFKQIDPYLLSKINVSYQNQLIRRYNLGYRIGKFEKTLLDSISENDGKDSLFYTHKFEYYDDIAANGYYTTSVYEHECPTKCFSTTFPIPMDTTTVYTYQLNPQHYWFAFTYRGCAYPYFVDSVFSCTVNNVVHYPSPNNLFVTDYVNGHVTNLCPNPPPPCNAPYYGIQNPDFCTNMEQWFYNDVFSNLVYCNINNATYVDQCYGIYGQYLQYYGVLKSLSHNQDGNIIDHMVYHNWIIYNNILLTSSEVMPIGLNTDISVSTSSGSHDFGKYNLSVPYYVNKFNVDFRNQYPDTPPPTVSSANGEISINVPSTTLIFNSITLTAGGVSNTYYYHSCSESRPIAQSKGAWKSINPPKDEVELAIKKLIASGSELDKPIPNCSLNIAYEVNQDIINKSFSSKHELNNDNSEKTNNKNIIDGIYILHLSKDSLYWEDSNRKIIVDQKTIDILDELLPKEKKLMYNDQQKQFQEIVIKNRIKERDKAKAELDEKNKSLMGLLKSDENKIIPNNQLMQKASTDLTVQKDKKSSVKNKSLNSSFFKDLNNNYKFSTNHLISSPDTGCDPIVNTFFHNPNLGPTYSSTASLLGSTAALSVNLSGYLGIGIGCNPLRHLLAFNMHTAGIGVNH